MSLRLTCLKLLFMFSVKTERVRIIIAFLFSFQINEIKKEKVVGVNFEGVGSTLSLVSVSLGSSLCFNYRKLW